MSSRIKISLFSLMAVFFFSQCNTYFWQPIDKQLVGTWRKSPQTSSYEEWTFTSDGKLYRVAVQNTDPVITDTILTCSSASTHTFEIENKITKQFIVTPDINIWCDTPDNPKWLIVQLSKGVLYITTVDDNGTKGAYQFGFVKI